MFFFVLESWLVARGFLAPLDFSTAKWDGIRKQVELAKSLATTIEDEMLGAQVALRDDVRSNAEMEKQAIPANACKSKHSADMGTVCK